MNRMSIRRLHMGCGESLMPLLPLRSAKKPSTGLLPLRSEKNPSTSVQGRVKLKLKTWLKQPVRQKR